MDFGEFVAIVSAMEFWDIVRTLGGLAILLAIMALPIWGMVLMTMELVGMLQGFHDLQLAYLISREDINKLTKKEWKMTRRMDYADLKTYLNGRFPESVPAIKKELEYS